MNTQDKDLRQSGEQQNNTEGYAKVNDQTQNAASENSSNSHGRADLTDRPSEGAVGSTHSSGISTKRSVTGSDFDGQVSPS